MSAGQRAVGEIQLVVEVTVVEVTVVDEEGSESLIEMGEAEDGISSG